MGSGFDKLSRRVSAPFLALVETGRFKYWRDDAGEEYSDGHWFWTQAAHCTYDLPPGARFEQDLRWYVPPSARISTPTGMQPIHDNRLISAALTAEAERPTGLCNTPALSITATPTNPPLPVGQDCILSRQTFYLSPNPSSC
jgi:hypothetical protein